MTLCKRRTEYGLYLDYIRTMLARETQFEQTLSLADKIRSGKLKKGHNINAVIWTPVPQPPQNVILNNSAYEILF